MVIFPLGPDQTIAQMWSNGARGGIISLNKMRGLKSAMLNHIRKNTAYNLTLVSNTTHSYEEHVQNKTWSKHPSRQQQLTCMLMF